MKDAIKLTDPSCHGTVTNFSGTVKFADPNNPLLGPGMGVVSPMQAELLPILCSNSGGWLPWQQRTIRGKFKGQHSIARPQKTQFGANSVHVAPKVPEL